MTCTCRSRRSTRWREPGSDVSLRIHTHVREDALNLYGFATRLELQIFERLIGVSGIGPKLALAVLSGIEPNELVSAIRTANVARLTGIPGIGKKTAERIGLELKDKMASFLPADTAVAAPIDDTEALRTDLLSALMNLGYHRPLAERAVSAAMKKASGSSFEASLKLALRELATLRDHLLHTVRGMNARSLRAAISVIFAAFVLTLTHGCGHKRPAGYGRQHRRALAGARRCCLARSLQRSGRGRAEAEGRCPVHVGRHRYHRLQSRDSTCVVPTAVNGASSSVLKHRPKWWRREFSGPSATTSRPRTTCKSWELSGGPGGRQPEARFRDRHRRREGRRRLVVDRERVHRHSALPRVDRRQHRAEQLGLEDVEQQDLSPCRRHAALRRARSRRLARQDLELEASCGSFPMRGFGQGSRNDIDGFESQGFIKRRRGRRGRIRFRDRFTARSSIWFVPPT